MGLVHSWHPACSHCPPTHSHPCRHHSAPDNPCPPDTRPYESLAGPNTPWPSRLGLCTAAQPAALPGPHGAGPGRAGAAGGLHAAVGAAHPSPSPGHPPPSPRRATGEAAEPPSPGCPGAPPASPGAALTLLPLHDPAMPIILLWALQPCRQRGAYVMGCRLSPRVGVPAPRMFWGASQRPLEKS